MYSRGEDNPLIVESPPDDEINIITTPHGYKFWTYKVSPHKDKCDCTCHIGETIWNKGHCKCGFSMGSMRLINYDETLGKPPTEDQIEMGHHDPSISWPIEYVRKNAS